MLTVAGVRRNNLGFVMIKHKAATCGSKAQIVPSNLLRLVAVGQQTSDSAELEECAESSVTEMTCGKQQG